MGHVKERCKDSCDVCGKGVWRYPSHWNSNQCEGCQKWVKGLKQDPSVKCSRCLKDAGGWDIYWYTQACILTDCAERCMSIHPHPLLSPSALSSPVLNPPPSSCLLPQLFTEPCIALACANSNNISPSAFLVHQTIFLHELLQTYSSQHAYSDPHIPDSSHSYVCILSFCQL